MKQATRTRKSQPQPQAELHRFWRRLREGIFILTSAVSLFILLALVTYHRADPGWSHTALSANVHNAGGRVGAYIADFLLYIFGYLAYLFPLMLSYAAWMFARGEIEEDNEYKYYFLLLRSSGFILVLASGCALASLDLLAFSGLPFTTGGLVGNLVGLGMVKVFNSLGTTLILIALFLSGMTLFTGLSWMKLADQTGRLAYQLMNSLYERFTDWRQGSDDDEEDEEDDEVDEDEEEDEPVRKRAKKAETRVEPKLKSRPVLETADKPVIVKSPPIKPSLRSEQDRQEPLFQPVLEGGLPPLSLLDPTDHSKNKSLSNQELEEMSKEVELKLQDFNIDAKVVAVHPGPVVTRYELQLAAGTKVSRVSALSKDLARSLSVISVRVVDIIPGKSVIGLELPNEHREIVGLREVLASTAYEQARSPLTLALGKDIAGHPVIVDLAKMPHLLVAGTTGSGKSVGLNVMLLSLLHKSSPKDLRMILIDPKMLELSIYEGIPHLLTPVVTDMKDASNALRWCVAEMERRYRLMASLGVRNLAGYNKKVKETREKGAPLLDPLWQASTPEEEQPELQELPYIVVIADEFADMMMVVGKKVEELIARIAQKARAAGIHLILATQRPSVDVITGLIKANIPTRIAFQVSSKIDSRTILDQQGAEQLLGHGDMLYLPPGSGLPVRVHGAFVADEEVHRVVSDLKRRGQPDYLEEITAGGQVTGDPVLDADMAGDEDGEQDPLYDQAVQIVIQSRRASISNIQRRLKIGYNRAARMIETMEAAGVVGPMEGSGAREVLVVAEED